MIDEFEKIFNIAAIVILVIIAMFVGFMVYEFFDILNDHYCYQLEPQEFINEPKCKKYWEDK